MTVGTGAVSELRLGKNVSVVPPLYVHKLSNSHTVVM